jgi:hypothetical protein
VKFRQAVSAMQVILQRLAKVRERLDYRLSAGMAMVIRAPGVFFRLA